MPIYKYRCQRCERFFEKIQEAGEEGESLKCPFCGEERPKKVLSNGSSSMEGEETPSSCYPSTRVC